MRGEEVNESERVRIIEETDRAKQDLVNREEAAFTLGYYYGVSALQPDYDHSLAIWRQLEDRHAALKRALNYLKHGY